MNKNNVRIAVRDSTDSHNVAFFDNKAGIKYKSANLHRFLAGSASILTIKYNSKDIDSIRSGCKLAFRYKNRDYCLNVMSFEKKGFEVELTAYSLGFELNNETRGEHKPSNAMSIAEYVAYYDPEHSLTIGVNEVSSKRIKLEWTGTDTILARLFSVANSFGAELDFNVELNDDYSLKRQVLNIYKKGNLGTNKVSQPVRVGKELKVINYSDNIKELRTAVRATGKDGLTIDGLNKKIYDNNKELLYYSSGMTVYAPQSRDRFPSVGKGSNDNWIVKDLGETQYETKEALWGYMYGEIQKISVPEITYEVEGAIEAGIGDTQTLIDGVHFEPALYVQARVSELEDDILTGKVTKSTFINFERKYSQISDKILHQMEELINQNLPYKIALTTDNGLTFRNNFGESTVTPKLMKGEKEVSGVSWNWNFKETTTTANTFTVKASTIKVSEMLTVTALINNQVIISETIQFSNIMDDGQLNIDEGEILQYPLYTSLAHENGAVRPEIFGSTIQKNGRTFYTPLEIVSSHYPMYDRAVSIDSLETLQTKAKEWSDGYFDFLQHNTSDVEPIAINGMGLVGASYITDDPHTSYTPPTTGTSEGQLLVLRGLLNQYLATKDTKWKTLAEKVTDGLLNYYYPTATIPTTADPSWIPHWLVNVTAPFTSREYFTNGEATFSNGVANVDYDKVFRIYSVRSTDSTLEYTWSPTAPIVGTEYEIESTTVSYGNSSATITLKDKTFSGDALIVYSSETGPIIQIGDKCEAYPVWRPLNNGEIACAVDTLPWALDCFKLWYEITEDEKWQRAIASTKAAIKNVSSVTNTIYYLKAGEDGEEVLKNGVTSYSERSPKETYTNSDGAILIDYSAVESKAEGSVGTWVGNKVALNNDKWIEAKLWSNKSAKMTIKIDEEETYDASRRWKCDFYTDGKGSGNPQTLSFKHGDFYKDDNILWGLHYGHDANSSAITSSNSTVTTSETIVNQKKVTEFVFHRGDEGGWLGWAQSMLSIWGVKLPFDIKYKTSSRIAFRVNDSAGAAWSYELPKTDGKFKTITLTEELVANGGTMASGAYQSLILEAIDENASMQIEYFGTLEFLDKYYYTSIHLAYSETEALQIGLDYIKPAPSRNPLPYAPYIMPFDMHYINYELSNLRGAIYTGYQVPWIYQEGIFDNSTTALTTNLRFLSDSQDAFEELTGHRGFFAPIFWWDYLDDASGHEPNTFGIEGNWGTVWGGFQYRTISDVARVFENDTSNQLAHDISIRFFKGVKQYWTNTMTDFPTVFIENHEPYNDQRDPHMVTNLMRALIYTLKCTLLTDEELELVKDLLEKCVNYLVFQWIETNGFSNSLLEGTWSPNLTDKTWYEYWGGDILDALALLQTANLQTVSSAFAYTYDTTVNKTYKFKLANVSRLESDDHLYLDSSDSLWKINRSSTGTVEVLDEQNQYKMNHIKTFGGGTYLYLITDKDVTPQMKGVFKSAQWYSNYCLEEQLNEQSVLTQSVQTTLLNLIQELQDKGILTNN